MQLDSWWYYKSSVNSGLVNWTAMSGGIFPDGIGALHAATGLPLVAHNRFFAADTDYARQNGGEKEYSS